MELIHITSIINSIWTVLVELMLIDPMHLFIYLMELPVWFCNHFHLKKKLEQIDRFDYSVSDCHIGLKTYWVGELVRRIWQQIIRSAFPNWFIGPLMLDLRYQTIAAPANQSSHLLSISLSLGFFLNNPNIAFWVPLLSTTIWCFSKAIKT